MFPFCNTPVLLLFGIYPGDIYAGADLAGKSGIGGNFASSPFLSVYPPAEGKRKSAGMVFTARPAAFLLSGFIYGNHAGADYGGDLRDSLRNWRQRPGKVHKSCHMLHSLPDLCGNVSADTLGGCIHAGDIWIDIRTIQDVCG